MKPIFFVLFFATPFFAAAQQQEFYDINLQSSLWSVIPFYFLTLCSLSLFVWKLIRPQFPTRWLYLCTILGIAAAVWATLQFKHIQDSQLPAANNQIYELPETPDNRPMTSEELDNYSKDLYQKRQKDVQMQQFANFWVMAIPNFIVFVFGLYWDWRARRDKNNPNANNTKRSRYA